MPKDRVALGVLDTVADTLAEKEFVLAVGVIVGVTTGDAVAEGDAVSDWVAVPVMERVTRAVFVR